MKNYVQQEFISRSCLSKNAYATEARAEMEAARARDRNKRNKLIHAYHCLFEDHWHLGHDKKLSS